MTAENNSYRTRPISHSFEANGLKHSFQDWGEGSPRHLVMLHGLQSQSHTFDGFATQVRDDFRVVAPDLRGHGETDHAVDGYLLERFVADLRALVRHLNLPSLSLVGHSLGSFIAIRFAADYPELVDRLVLEDGGPGLDFETARDGSTESFVKPLGFDTIEDAKAWLRERNPNDSDERLERRVAHTMKQNWAEKWVIRHDHELYWLLAEGSRGLHEQVQELWDMLASITCPVLLVRGGESPLLSSEAAQRIVDATGNGTLVEIPNAGHSVHSEKPDEFRQAVVTFLKG